MAINGVGRPAVGDFTQRQLARAFGVSQSVLGDAVRGARAGDQLTRFTTRRGNGHPVHRRRH